MRLQWGAMALLGAAIPTSTAAANVFSALALLLIVLDPGFWRWLRAEGWRDALLLGAALLFALYALSMLYTSVTRIPPWRALLGHRELLLLAPLLYVCREPRIARATLWGLAAGCAASLAVSLAMAASGKLWLNAVAGNYPAFKTHTYHNLFVGLLGLAALAAALRGGSPQRRAGLLMVFALCAVDVLVLVLGRTTQLTFIMLLGALALLAVRGTWQRLAMSGIAVLIVAAAALQPKVQQRYALAVREAQQYAQGSTAETSIGMRLAFWQNTAKVIASAPLLGHGVGSFREEYEKVRPREMPNYGNPHSDYLLLWSELGLVGLAAFVAWIVIAGLRLRQVHEDLRFVAFTVWFSMVAASLVNSFFTDFTTSTAYAVALAALLGYRPRGTAHG